MLYGAPHFLLDALALEAGIYKYSRERSLEAPDIADVGADKYCLSARGVSVALLAGPADCWYIGFPCAGRRAGGSLSTPN